MRLALALHVFRDGRLTDVDPEFQQFAMNPRRAPPRVRVRHRANQRPDVGRHGRSPHATPALPRPPQAEASSVPGDDGLGLDDDERRSPSGPVCVRADFRANGPPSRAATAAAECACSTCSWCRNARISSWSAARERTHVRRLRRRVRSTGIIARKRIHRRPQHQLPPQERTL